VSVRTALAPSEMSPETDALPPSSDRTLYSDERLAKLGNEAGRVDSAFSLNDRSVLLSRLLPPNQ
jgi:hypothetical protein